ncbi:MAG: hypothetical protein DIU79_02830 [Actinobacteria bacterium]|nr:MAG: hypothetical protein DIU79_02830 [Actinomycetota bacterium]
MNGFTQRFQELQRRAGRKRILTPDSALTEWANFATSVAAGYEMGLDEYVNDLSLRRVLEEALNDPVLASSEGYLSFRASVQSTDDILKGSFSEHLIGHESAPWWERGVPRLAGRKLADDLLSVYGIVVEVKA